MKAEAALSDLAAETMPPSLVRVSDEEPGIRRLRRGKGFAYLRPDGRPLRDAATLARIRKLAIPPAYEDVWICPKADGHLQATGRDARGRKQYRYHTDWRLARDETKFAQLVAFGLALPRLRRRVVRALAAMRRQAGRADPEAVAQALPRLAVLAALVRLLDTTCARIGNDEYARDNRSYGLTTLRPNHVRFEGEKVLLRFRGKSGVMHGFEVEDLAVAEVVRRARALRGRAVFQWRDEDGRVHGISSDDVNDYLREATGIEATAKTFRTWHASALALSLLGPLACEKGCSKRQVREALTRVAERLGNTVAVCRKSYVHPGVLQHALDDRLWQFVQAAQAACDEVRAAARRARARGLVQAERQLMDFLHKAGAA